MNTKTKYKKRQTYTDTFGELPLTGILPIRDSEMRGVIERVTKANAMVKRPVNKFFPIKNTYQEPTKQLWQGNKS